MLGLPSWPVPIVGLVQLSPSVTGVPLARAGRETGCQGTGRPSWPGRPAGGPLRHWELGRGLPSPWSTPLPLPPTTPPARESWLLTLVRPGRFWGLRQAGPRQFLKRLVVGLVDSPCWSHWSPQREEVRPAAWLPAPCRSPGEHSHSRKNFKIFEKTNSSVPRNPSHFPKRGVGEGVC